MKKVLYIIVAIILGCWLISKCNSDTNNESENDSYFVYDKAYKSFVGTYVVDLTILQSRKTTTIVLNPDGSGYFQQGDSYESHSWWPADNGGGICFSGQFGDEQSRYYMNKSRTKMYWGLNNYMNDKGGYDVSKID